MLPGDSEAYDQAQRDKFASWGIDHTRRLLIEGRLGTRKAGIARAWLSVHDAASEAEQREIDREIGRGANQIAARALARSTFANIVAAIAVVVAIAAAAIEWHG